MIVNVDGHQSLQGDRLSPQIMNPTSAASMLSELPSPLPEADAARLISLDLKHLGALVDRAHTLQQERSGSKVDLCAIVNARSGSCEQDCAFCSQSAHASSEIDIHSMKDAPEIVEHARRAEAAGAHRFCIVTSGGSLSPQDFETALNAIESIAMDTQLSRCASLGALTEERARRLADSGLDRYHHNLETARSFYPEICTTQSYDSRIQTVMHLRSAGVELCSGGILGLGESPEQRIEFAADLQRVAPDSVPINFLSPRPGTALEGRPQMQPKEAIRYLAIFRMMLPDSIIRLAGGRCETLGGDQELALRAGIDGLLIGDYLTTFGPQVTEDKRLLERLGFDLTLGRC